MNEEDPRVRDPFKKNLLLALDTVKTPAGKILQPLLLLVNLYACIHFVLGIYIENEKLRDIYILVEWAIFAWFSLEYALRLYAHSHRLRFVFSFYGIIDLLSILPTLFADGSMIYLRAFRTFRILRFLRFLEDEEFFFGTMTKTGLQIVRVVYTLVTLIFISSSAVYECESLAHGGSIQTYFDAVYFTVITLTTVGYGDITPVTDSGKVVTVLMIISGVIFIPWQAGKLIKIILVLSEEKRDVHCTRCGLTRHDLDAVHCKMCGLEIYQEYDGT